MLDIDIEDTGCPIPSLLQKSFVVEIATLQATSSSYSL